MSIHRRRSISLKGYDYSEPGAYFVTICTQDRVCLLGEVVDGEVRLSDAGRVVQAAWNELSNRYPGVEIDAFMVMPNHIHGIILLVESVPGVGAGLRACPDPDQTSKRIGQPQGVAPTRLSLSDVMHRFKTMTTKRYADGVNGRGWQPFHGRLWQRNYYEHVIRNDSELDKIRKYITTNPLKWALDRENPQRGALR